MPSTLNCPACGAPAPSATAARCDYCGSALTRAACPSCFGPVFVGMEFCPHCGARATRVADDSAPPLPCPGCHGAMGLVHVGATPIYECGACGSNWLDTESFTQLCLSREQRGAVATMIGSAQSPSNPPSSGVVRYVACPVCRKIMNRQNFGHASGVVIDVCKGHGAWFEYRELQAVLAFVDSGGFELAKQADQERKAKEREKLEKEFIASGQAAVVSMQIAVQRSRGDHDDNSLIDQALRKLFQ